MGNTCFGEAREGSHEWKSNPGIREAWHAKDVGALLADMWDYSNVAVEAVADSAESLEDRFLRLANTWSAETGHISSATDLIKHPSYQEIIGMGWSVVPYLLIDLQRNKRFWFPALAAITGIRPFDRSDYGNGRRMIEAWIKWGKRKGLI